MNNRSKVIISVLVLLLLAAAGMYWNGAGTIHLPRSRARDSSSVGEVNGSLSGVQSSLSLGGTSSKTKVLLIGLDGAGWNIIRPLVRRNKLPNFAHLMRDGVSGTLLSSKPLLSPLIWTTIATGKKPTKHGITDFLVVNHNSGEEIPVTRNLRAVKAFWNILSEQSRTVGVIGWLVTWPSEAINGFMVSDRLTFLDYDPNKAYPPLSKQVTYPETLLDKLTPMITKPQSITFDTIRRFLDVDLMEFNESIKNVTEPVFTATSVIAATETYRKIAMELLREQPKEVLAVYFKGIDSFGHLFASRSQTILPAGDHTGAQKYGRAIQEFYLYQDEILGDLIGAVDDSATVIVVSDHGFETGENRPAGQSEIGNGHASEWHSKEGIVIMKGRDLKKGVTVTGARTVDIAPTVLYLLGLPVAHDMDGDVLTDAFVPNHLRNNPVQYVETFEDAKTSPPERHGIASNEDDAIKRQLQSLGYLNPKTANSYNNLGILQMEEGDYGRAADAYKKAIGLRPDVAAFYDNLGTAYNALGLHREAIGQHQKAIRIDPKFSKAQNNLGIAYFDLGEYDSARQAYETALSLHPNYAEALGNLGNVYFAEAAVEKAEELLLKSLRIDPSLAISHYNLGVMYGHRHMPVRALAEFKKVLEIAPHFPQSASVYNGRGIAYFELKMFKEALAEFRKTIQLDPKFLGVHSRMGIVYASMGNPRKGKEEFRKELEINPGNIMVRRALEDLGKTEKKE